MTDAYAAAGVSIEAGDQAVELMKTWVEKASRPEVIGGIGGFAGLFDASALKKYDRPLLATSADGVGTKVAVAQAMDKHDTIGFDLVGMLVDDLVVCGAEPLFLTDYIATGRVVPERIAAIVKGIIGIRSLHVRKLGPKEPRKRADGTTLRRPTASGPGDRGGLRPVEEGRDSTGQGAGESQDGVTCRIGQQRADRRWRAGQPVRTGKGETVR